MSTLRKAVWEKTKFFLESEDFARNQETWEIFTETQSNQVKILGGLTVFGNVSHRFRMIFQIIGTAFVRAFTPPYLLDFVKVCIGAKWPIRPELILVSIP